MALIKYGIVVTDARGSIGGVVLSRNAAGAIARKRTVPTYPATARQQNVAALMTTVVNDWKAVLTTAQRDAWNSLAATTSLPNKLGEQFSPSGFNLFMRSNMALDLSSQAHVIVPPISAVAPAPQFTLAWTTLVGNQVTAIGNWDSTGAGNVLVQKLLNGPLSQNYYKGPYVTTTFETNALIAAVPYVLDASAALVAESRSHYRFRAVGADGGVSTPVYLASDVGTPP